MSSQVRLAGLVSDSIVDGPGLRLTVFTQGCPHHCPGCHNPETHAPDGGTMVEIDTIEAKMTVNPLLSGVTLSGGEPFAQPLACADIARRAHKHQLTVWTYTGYTYETLIQKADPDILALLNETDVLVDGPFVLERRSLELKYRGSGNQRILDMAATRRDGAPRLWTPPEW